MSARLWRHQGVLALVAGVLLIVASLLVGWASEVAGEPPAAVLALEAVDAADTGAVRRLTWAVSAAGAATATALVFALVHVTRVLSLTFKGEGE